MVEIAYDPETERRPWKPIERIDMRSPELRRKQARAKEEAARKERAAQREREMADRHAYLEMLAREAAKARTEILARKAAAKAAAEAEGMIVVEADLAMSPASRIEKIEWLAVRLFKFSRAEMRGYSRSRDVAFARHFVMYWARRLTPLSLPQIGKILGKDHTTVLHGSRAYVAKRRAMKPSRFLRPAR